MTTSANKRRHTFLIRIWREPGPFSTEAQGNWRAHIQHVPSGESRYVDDITSLITFFEQWTGALHQDAPRPQQLT